MSENLKDSLAASRYRWKKTLGERVIRLIGISMALVSVVVGAKYGLDGGFTIQEPAPYQVKRPTPPENREVSLVLPPGTGTGNARIHALHEAIASYFGIQVSTTTPDEALHALSSRTSLVLIYGDKTLENGDALGGLLRQAVDRDIPVAWIGPGFGTYAAVLGFRSFDEAERRTLPAGSRLIYRETAVPADGLGFVDGDFGDAEPESARLAQVELHGAFSRPAVLTSSLGVFIRFDPFSASGTSYALPVVLDVLSRFLGRHAQDPRVVFRVEDVNAIAYGPADTRFAAAAQYLSSEGVPLHLAVIPIMVDPDGEERARIGEAEPVLDFVRAHRRDVAIAQHGTLHFRQDPRNEGMGSGDAYEFFFDDEQTMGEQAAREFARERLEKGYRVMARAGIEPTMFEAPHLEMSPGQEAVAMSMYPVMLHQPMFFGEEKELVSLTLPWLTERDGTVYAPSDAGYVSGSDSGSVERIIEKLEMLRGIMQDPVVVVFYHPFLIDKDGGREELIRLVERIEDLGYRFVNLMDEIEPVPGGT